MHAEAAFLAGYALSLVALATGLNWLGRRSADPWSSRMLVASRPPDLAELDLAADWPHSEVPKFHQGVGGVALAAALLLTVVNVVRHHRPIELVVNVLVFVLITACIARVLRAYRLPVVAGAKQRRP